MPTKEHSVCSGEEMSFGGHVASNIVVEFRIRIKLEHTFH